MESDKNLTGIGDLTLTEGKQVSLIDTEFDYESLGKTANDLTYQVSNRYDFSSLRELDSIGHNEYIEAFSKSAVDVFCSKTLEVGAH